MGSDKMHRRILRELGDVVAKPLSVISEKSWQMGEVPGGWKKRIIAPIFKSVERRTLGTINLSASPLCLGKIMEQIFLEAMVRHMEDREMIWDSQHGFTRDKSCLINLMALYNGVTTTVDKGRGTECYLDFCKAFDTVPNNILLSKLERYKFDGWIVRCMKIWLDGCIQRVAVDSSMSR
ncbi:rna-directed dna polymerase from mobile element jockey- hypothetical protein [Limosa lapponica baueri]|uniref:Uncharacterized protein n=1 Tax=Limosa lapponica baueri TaxID=1758121 RepID=A0A2I0UHN2_LIMLA|nr:rna-directed dna polymerase from mobile element jockey- hypothetical protein [Limosa lapponica baueri]